MNVFSTQEIRRGRTFAALAFSALVAAACAAEVRNKLTVLQNDPNLAVRAKVEIRDAEAAVRLAEQPLPAADASLGAHRVYMADRQVEIARARATTRYAEDQRARFAEERDAARLAARTQEADDARYDADRATAEAERARAETDRARAATASATAEADRARAAAVAANSAADAARRAEAESSADAARQAADLQRQIDELQAEVTDRGLVLTLGDVLFTTGSAELQGGASDRLNKLINFLNEYPERLVLIEGHTDSMGSSEYNQGLSQRRSESVKSYLAQQGIATQRLSTSGLGEDQPIASNDSAAGRLQNRRVEIIIENPPLVIGASRQ
jgi:outer membrane protein OmpA-like peptidoglycan-associated protein